MVVYEENVKKAVTKGYLPGDIFNRFNNVFISLDTTHDLSIFDIKKLKSSEKRTYYRVRKGKYRAIFYIEENNFFVISIAKREEVYDKWE
jgi:mRNA interferase RelE/StbE